MRKKWLSVAVVLALLISVCSIALEVYPRHRIAYVRTRVLVNNYLGMREARDAYQKKAQLWQIHVDTLKARYNKSLESYKDAYAQLSKKEKQTREEELNNQHDDVIRYSRAIEKKAKEADNKMTQGVLNQINSYVADYGKKHGYDIIIGTTTEGNLMYGKDALDITYDILKGLNAAYDPKDKTSAADTSGRHN